MKLYHLTILLSLFFLIACHNAQNNDSSQTKTKEPAEPDTLTGQTYFSGFEDAHDTYNAISPASDGRIYYVLSSTRHDVGGTVLLL